MQLFVQQQQRVDIPDIVCLGYIDAIITLAQREITLFHFVEFTP